MVNLGRLWRPVIKGGAYPTGYFRSSKVARASERVKEINKKLIEAAKGCTGKHTSDKSFQDCIRSKMTGVKAGGVPSAQYVKALKYKGKIA